MANEHAGKTLGQVIRDARVAAGQSLREFARNLGITPSYQSDIENDRRIPSEEVLKKIAGLLNLDFEDLMALGGRFGEDAERYLRRHPTAGALFRKLSETNAPEDVLRKMLKEAEEIERKKEEGK
jgi:transcriptional regulator with XRE-family HTH domain